MAATSWETFFAQLFRDYLAESDAGSTGVPGEAVLRKVVGEEQGEQTRPLLVVTAVEEERPHREMAVMAVSLTVRYVVPAGEGSNLEGTAPATVYEWIKPITQRLKDVAAWHQWIAGLDEERRTGWRVLMSPRLEPTSETRDDVEHTAEVVMMVKLRVWLP